MRLKSLNISGVLEVVFGASCWCNSAVAPPPCWAKRDDPENDACVKLSALKLLILVTTRQSRAPLSPGRWAELLEVDLSLCV